RFDQQTKSPVFVAAVGGKHSCLAWIPKPFILERAKPSKDGDAKPLGLRLSGRWSPGCRRDGQVKNPSVPGCDTGQLGCLLKCEHSIRIQGSALPVTRGLSCFFPRISSFPLKLVSDNQWQRIVYVSRPQAPAGSGSTAKATIR